MVQVLVRLLALTTAVVLPVSGQAISPVADSVGAKAQPFDISQVVINTGRHQGNQDRVLNFLKDIDTQRLLYVFRATHGLSTEGAEPNGGWDAPDFDFRSHIQGHYLSAWSQCWASLKDEDCRSRAVNFVAELQKCQQNNGAAGMADGYLSGFPESYFDQLENLSERRVLYYSYHKTMAGLLDVWRHVGDETARDVLLGMANWVDQRTAGISYEQMQNILSVEYGGMQDTLADLYRYTGDQKWNSVAARFDQEETNSFLANNDDRLDGYHANTQIPKWIGVLREYRATGTQRYMDIARNAWNMVVNAHSYAIGGNSDDEHFHAPNAIGEYLTGYTAEHCNTYNMLKLTKDLWALEPEAKYFDFYERALQNHIIGAQDPNSNHGHITYFSPLKAADRKGRGPRLGGGTWGEDYNTNWCCQGSSIEQSTRLMDAIYGFDDSSLYINMFLPSTLDWTQKGVKVTQSGQVPTDDTPQIAISGSGAFDMKIRIPNWANNAAVSVNGEQQSIDTTPGAYATVSRNWVDGDTVAIKLDMKPYLLPANDNQTLTAIGYGPMVLIGNYGDNTLNTAPTLELNTLQRTSGDNLAFTATADGQTINLGPYQDGGVDFNFVTYWARSGDLQ